MDDDNKTYPEGFFLAIGMAIGLPFGLVFVLVLDNPGFIGMGIPFGLAIGLALEAKYKKEGKIRPLTPEHYTTAKTLLIAGIIIGLILFGLFLFGLFH